MEFPVFFCVSENAAHRVMQPRSIVVWPVDPNWNDFGYGFQARARFSSAGAIRPNLDLDVLVIPAPGEQDANRFDLWLKSIASRDGIVEASKLRGRFFSIVKSEQEYRRLVKWSSDKQIELDALLLPLRDIVFYRAKLLDTDAIETFLRSEAAQKGVFRREPTYLAWHRGFRFLAGSNVTEVDDSRTEFSFETLLPGFNGAHSLRISYGVPRPLSDRCHALIGVNGVGKSTLLRELVIALGQKLDGTGVDPFTSGSRQHGKQTTLLPDSFRINRVLVLSWDSQSAYPPAARLNSQFQYLHFTMRDDEFDPQERVPFGTSDTLASQLIQLFREDRAGIGKGFDRLRTALRPVFDLFDIAVAVSPINGGVNLEWLSLREIRGANEERQLVIFSNLESSLHPKRWDENHGAVELSSGEKAFLNFGIRCAARVVEGTLLVLDEPETHLHPNLISNFMRVLQALLESTRSIALIATHSPFVVRELPGRCVHVLRVDEDRTPITSSAFLRTFGASVDTLAADIFQDAESNQVNLDVAHSIAESGMNIDQIRDTYGREISPELLSEIRQLMRDSIR